MAAHDLTITGDSTPAWNKNVGDRFVLETTVSFATNVVAQNDTLTVFDIPAGTYVEGIYIANTTKEGGTATIDVTGGAVDGTEDFLTAADLNASTAIKVYSGNQWLPVNGAQVADAHTIAPPLGRGKLFTADGAIKILANHALDAAVITLKVFCLKVA